MKADLLDTMTQLGIEQMYSGVSSAAEARLDEWKATTSPILVLIVRGPTTDSSKNMYFAVKLSRFMCSSIPYASANHVTTLWQDSAPRAAIFFSVFI